jgi:hypothetical protein
MLSDTLNLHDINKTICVHRKQTCFIICVQQFVFFTYRVVTIGKFDCVVK